jgi:hypothetical protein
MQLRHQYEYNLTATLLRFELKKSPEIRRTSGAVRLRKRTRSLDN